MAQEAAYCPAEIVRQVTAIDSIAIQVDSGLASGRCAMSEQDTVIRMTQLQCLDERFGCAGFADRDGV